jgi:hypothetical protein
VRRKRQATCSRDQTCEGLSENPKSAAGRVGEDRASGQAALARLADSGTPRDERTAVHDRSRAADAILAQSGMVGEPSSGYHGEPLAGLMTLPRIQRRLFSEEAANVATRLKARGQHFTVATCRTEPTAPRKAENRHCGADIPVCRQRRRDRPGCGNPGQRDATGKR